MANDGDETTAHLIEGTRAAREAAEEAVEDVHEDADELEERLESEGLEPGAGDEE